VKREVQRIVKVVVKISARTDQEVDEPSFHQLNHAATQTSWRQSSGDSQRNGGVVFRQEHLVRKNTAGLSQSRRIERLEPVVDKVMDVGAPSRPIVSNGLPGQIVGP
jgi:hypothetical protein